MKQWLGVAVGLHPSLEYQRTRSFECQAYFFTADQRQIYPITGILPVHLYGHPAKRVFNVVGADDAVQQPVCDMLRGYPERRPILHQANVVNIRDLRTANTLVNPSDDVTENALGIVIKLLSQLVLLPVSPPPRAGLATALGAPPVHRVACLAD